jgi:GDP/UDP-N,N'-diacetylbacillosamine 2-epimerase (hydrolysing)
MKKICVISSSRSEYGLLKDLLKQLKKSKKLKPQLIVTGSHLSDNFGKTITDIINDGFFIDKKFNISPKQDKILDYSKSVSIGVNKFSNSFRDLKPDLIIILGDRYEIMSAAYTALLHKIPIAHLHGGERSEGAYDESIRHAITKLSHLHFVSANVHKKRVIQLGEKKENVHLVGSIGVSNIKKIKFFSKKLLEKKLKIKFNKKNLFIIYHPETLEENSQKKDFKEILKASSYFKNFNKFFIYPSADLGGKEIIKLINNYVKRDQSSFKFKSLKQKDYFSLVKNCSVVIGNSSSGIIEVPSLNVGVINVGDRQKGRFKSNIVLDCKPKAIKIINNIKKILTPDYQKKIRLNKNIYYYGDTSKKIIKVLEKKKEFKSLIKKKFFDL